MSSKSESCVNAKSERQFHSTVKRICWGLQLDVRLFGALIARGSHEYNPLARPSPASSPWRRPATLVTGALVHGGFLSRRHGSLLKTESQKARCGGGRGGRLIFDMSTSILLNTHNTGQNVHVQAPLTVY